MAKKRLFVLSADAMVTEDVEYLKTLPNYKKYLAGGSMVKRVRTIYPTITYPCHTSMATGTYPNKHGLYSNLEFHAGELKLPWAWFHDRVKVPDIFTAAKKIGLTTAAVFWPVTGNHPDIDYLIAEYWTQSKDDTLREAFKRAGSNEEVLKIVDRHAPIMVERQHPMCDEFIVKCACDMIREFKPDLLMIHPANIDGYRHQTGLFNDKIKQGIEETDRWIGEMMEAAKEAGIADEVNFVLTSDHGQLDIKRIMNPNVIFAEHGLIQVGEDNKIVNWDAYCLSGGLSAMVYLKDPNNKEIYQKVYTLLQEMKEEGIYGISQVFTETEINELEHLGGDFSFVLESDDYTSFGDSWQRPLVSNFDLSDYRYGRATHGHLPDKGPQPIFVVKGPGFKEGVEIDRRPIVDEAPTYAKLLGTELPDADGIAIDEILAE